MNRLTLIAAAALRAAVLLLPPQRREWGSAVLAEVDHLPTGRTQLTWLLGGLWLVAREAGIVVATIRVVAGLAIGAALVWLDWHSGSENPAIVTDRLTMAVVVILLATLPALTRPWLGPVAGDRTRRTIRVVGYTTLYALVAVLIGLSRADTRHDHFHAFNQANWSADMRSISTVTGLLIITIFAGYTVAVLAITAQRTRITPRTVTAGVGAGIAVAMLGAVLLPLGNTLHLADPTLATGYQIALIAVPGIGFSVAGRVAGSPGQGRVAGMLAGGLAAALLATITITVMLLFPRHVTLEWDNPDPNVPHGTTEEIQMSVDDAAVKYQLALLIGPVVGLTLGTIGGGSRASRSARPARTLSPARRKSRSTIRSG